MVFIIFKIGYKRNMHIVQLLPELNQGGVERGTVELNRELVKRGHQSSDQLLRRAGWLDHARWRQSLHP